MRFRPLLLIALAAPVLGGGCVSSMLDQAADAKPEWFEAAAREVKGEGYPELADVPKADPAGQSRESMDTQAAKLKAAAAVFNNNPELSIPTETEEEIRARAAQLRALAEGEPTPSPSPTSSPKP